MTGPKYNRRVAAAVLALLLIPVCIAAAKPQGHKPKAHKPRCKPHYVARRVRVRKHEHHRVVWVRQWKCVKARRTQGTKTNRPTSTPPSVGITAPSHARDCAGTPGSGTPNYASMDACGYPSPDTTGVPAGTPLTASGSIRASTPGEVINGLAVTGAIDVRADNVTIENTDVANASSCCWGIRIEPGVTGTVLKYDTIHGTGTTSSTELAWGIYYVGQSGGMSADHIDFYNGERILNGPGTVTNSFCLDNVDNPGAHYECVYEGGGDVTLDHDTLLTAHNQTAAVFLSTDFAPLGTVVVTNNLLAGGGYTLYGGAGGTGGVGSETVTGNRFSRLYFSHGGEWGPDAYMPTGSYTWSGNVWDDTGQPVSH